MNVEQINAIQDAIGHEEDWLYRVELESKATGKPLETGAYAYHKRKLSQLKEGIK